MRRMIRIRPPILPTSAACVIETADILINDIYLLTTLHSQCNYMNMKPLPPIANHKRYITSNYK